MTDWKKVGARSRARGRRFETEVASMLGWSRVPFSGRNANFGEGDVIDGFINGAGWWLAECKMRTKPSGSVSVDGAWIEQAAAACERSGRTAIIIVGSKVDHRKPEGFVCIGPDSVGFFFDRCKHCRSKPGEAGMFMERPASIRSWDEVDFRATTVTTSKSGGFCLRPQILDKDWSVMQLIVQENASQHVGSWLILRLSAFAALVRHLDNFAIPGPNSEE